MLRSCYSCGNRVEEKEACWVKRGWRCHPCIQRIIDEMKQGGYHGEEPPPVATGTH